LKLKIPENLTRQAYRLIRDEILQGHLDAPRHLTEGYFARQFGISKSPIREALNLLESEGLIKIVPRRGAFVAEFSIHDIEEIYELREVLEALVVRNAVLDAKVLGRMRQAVQAAETSRQKGDKLGYMHEDAAFHAALAQASSNSRLRKMLENMRNQMLILRRKTFELTSQTSVKKHFEILDALEKGKRETAEELMAQHIRTVRTRLINHLREQAKPTASGRAIPERGKRRPAH
jgi:DNA-binding GntR family transcriptional regulator